MAKKLLVKVNGSEVTSEVVETTAEENAVMEQVLEEYNTNEKPVLEARKNIKASAKAKLVAGEALTEEEADTIVL
tara:strand:- start:91 stop:315 length:225 start_codon:yes stop_codon:yes gene_type:complete